MMIKSLRKIKFFDFVKKIKYFSKNKFCYFFKSTQYCKPLASPSILKTICMDFFDDMLVDGLHQIFNRNMFPRSTTKFVTITI